MADKSRIHFAGDDLLRPANEEIPIDEFDWDTGDSVLDVVQRKWFERHRAAPPKVVCVAGDRYGGCRIELENHVSLELIPCDSDRGEHSEHWRLLGHRPDDSHFVVAGHGIEGAQEPTDAG
jgi:hypothetical protein